MNHPALFTFGYEGLSIDDFIARLKEAKVEMIVDVRELPLSRKKGFSKTAFREALSTAGIAYQHILDLGCPKNIRDQYRLSGDWITYTRGFLAHLDTKKAEVRSLAAAARSSQLCLVCYEADHNFCHRTYVARAARAAGAPVVQHLSAKTVLSDQPTLLVA